MTVKRLQEANAFDRNLGRIFQASGPNDTYHSTDNSSSRLDYGTVELTERRCSGSFPTTNPGCAGIIKQLLAHSSSNYMVFASGRTRGHRYGQLHETDVIIREYDGDEFVFETTERAILPWDPPGTAGPRPVPFADHGDSGALVFNHNRRIGIIFGGLEGQTSTVARTRKAFLPQDLPVNVQDVTFFTPIGTVVSAFKDCLNEAYGQDNFTLRWAGDNGPDL